MCRNVTWVGRLLFPHACWLQVYHGSPEGEFALGPAGSRGYLQFLDVISQKEQQNLRRYIAQTKQTLMVIGMMLSKRVACANTATDVTFDAAFCTCCVAASHPQRGI